METAEVGGVAEFQERLPADFLNLELQSVGELEAGPGPAELTGAAVAFGGWAG